MERSVGEPRSSDEGFTLVEVIAAVVLFLAISASTITILLMALDTIEGNNDRVLAANVARSRIEQLRLLGTDRILPGLTYDQPPGTPEGFTVETSAQWVAAGQAVSTCDAASPGQAYLRVRVAASAPDLGAPAVMDTILVPDAVATNEGTAAIAVSVQDHQGLPVSGVRIAAVDPLRPANSFTYLTGADGCLYIPGLTAGGDLNITVSKDGYVSATPTGNQGTSSLDVGSLAKPTFLLAPAASIDFTGALADYPLPLGTPVIWQVNETGAVIEVAATGVSVLDQWPTTSGFSAWAGECPDADPLAYDQTPQSFDFTAGGSTVAALDARAVRITGLPPATQVTVTHVGSCDTPPLDAGTSGEDGTLQVGLPSGSWEFSAQADRVEEVNGETVTTTFTETVALADPLSPAQAGPAAVQFTLAEQIAPDPAPSTGPTIGTSPSPGAAP